ncbi:MAG: DUF1761 domain-containing protein [Parvularculaceae bacterium]|nr:DUF1761 domain-containing protein [Parvularculaceae bacterium]
MPKLSLPGVLAATVVFWLIGVVWFGVLFATASMAAEGVDPAAAQSQSPLWMAGGVLITLAQVLGLALVIRWKGDYSAVEAAKTALLLWALFALPFTLYAFFYNPAHDLALLAIDSGHLLAAWTAAGAVLGAFK